ncbi:putative glutamate--cysteine ligase 2 [Reticulibacter mediterranei]|uniref:Putative glutamate--cysteine ligase 2 n=1 Tax=Reticulibacter mediterranei TaxID=2778369 RepID=A0A8J3IK64_9CHLR|nr:carboxylate-amine ligase [Reticulibacter mediterranei]GHO92944.1 putative glutamate--cysteine ligase 2 [Reticulibacter mediterranei]
MQKSHRLVAYTLGIEEEFQLVDRQTGELSSYIEPLLARARPLLGEQIKAEYFQSMVELNSRVCVDVEELRSELVRLRTLLAQITQQDDVAIVSAGTHPFSSWLQQQRSAGEHYQRLEAHLQDIARSSVCFGLHIHVGIEDEEATFAILNQVRTWIPHLLALASNSPFFDNRFTGFKAYRPVLWSQVFTRHGVTPGIFSSWHEFESYLHHLVATGCVSGSRELCWDIRPNPHYNTLEFRVCDMPATLEDALMLTALCQALVAKAYWLYRRGRDLPILPREYIEENKLLAARAGLDAQYIDFVHVRRLTMRNALCSLLEFVDEVSADLGSQPLLYRLHAALASGTYQTGADRQIALYQETGDMQEIVALLMTQTLGGIEVSFA